MADETPLLAYMTAPDRETALRLAGVLVDRRLVACVNMLPQMTAVFRWEGAVDTADEVAMLAKTTAARVAEIKDVIAAEHPYDTPCLIFTPIADGAPDFLTWIAAETRS